MKKWTRIILFLLGLTALFLCFENFSEIDFKEFDVLKNDKSQKIKATSPEGLAHELIYQSLPGIREFGGRLNNRFDGGDSSSGAAQFETEVPLSGSANNRRWKTSLINTTSVKMSYEDFEVICSKDGDVNINKKLSNKAEVEISRRPASDTQNIMLKYSW